MQEEIIELPLLKKINNKTKYYTPKKNDKILFIADNTDVLNFGCRGTSQALMDIITSKGYIISDRIRRNELMSLFISTDICDDVFQYISAVKNNDAIAYNNLLERIRNSDFLVLNGEGSFIFQDPPRHDMLIMLLLLYACIEIEKPFLVLNAMFTGYAQGTPYEHPINDRTFIQTIAIFEHSTLISARDKISFDLIKDNQANININYCPDALFSWYDFYISESEKFEKILENYPYCAVFNDTSEDIIQFDKKYILMGGNSHAAHFPVQAEICFTQLASMLKEMAKKNGIQLFIIECCVGDRILRKVSKNTGISLIPSETNILLAGYILGKAECFVSGRYHPSILASLGGTPCVYMGSNSHKTFSIQQVLGIPTDDQIVFDALPDLNEIKSIVEAAEKNMKKPRNKMICQKNCQIVNNLFFLE